MLAHSSLSTRLFDLSLLALLLHITPISSTSVVVSCKDGSCQNSIGSTNGFPGIACWHIPQANSVVTTAVDQFCAITVYSDINCSFDATLAPVGTCIHSNDKSWQSFSVDCQFPVSDSSTPVATPTSIPPSQGGLQFSTITQVTVLTISRPQTTFTTMTNTTTTLTMQPLNFSATLSQQHNSPVTTDSTASPSQIPPPSQPTTLATSGQIAIGVTVPATVLIVATILAINRWHKKKKKKKKKKQPSIQVAQATEMDGTTMVHELNGPYPQYELHGTWVHEMGLGRDSGKTGTKETDMRSPEGGVASMRNGVRSPYSQPGLAHGEMF